MKTYAAALAAICSLLLSGCSFSFTSEARSVPRSELESGVEDMFTAEDESSDAELTATCDGDLKAAPDATQDCHLELGDESADVRVQVTKVEGEETSYEATPFLPADRVAQTIESDLEHQGFDVESVSCDEELMGELDQTIRCSAEPAELLGDLDVEVTQVRGLMVNFNYEAVS